MFRDDREALEAASGLELQRFVFKKPRYLAPIWPVARPLFDLPGWLGHGTSSLPQIKVPKLTDPVDDDYEPTVMTFSPSNRRRGRSRRHTFRPWC